MADLEHHDDVRVVVVTGTPLRSASAVIRRRSLITATAAGYDSGLPAEPARPGGGDRLDADMAWQLGYRLPIIAAVTGACAGVGLSLGAAARPALRRRRRQAHDSSEARPARRVRSELDAAAPGAGVTGANDLLLSGRIVTGAETADWGLWNGVEADGTAALDAALAYGRMLAASARRTPSR